jgi:hypothetical protein
MKKNSRALIIFWSVEIRIWDIVIVSNHNARLIIKFERVKFSTYLPPPLFLFDVDLAGVWFLTSRLSYFLML